MIVQICNPRDKSKSGASTGSATFVYEAGVLQFFNTAEGYVEPVSTGSTNFVYVFQYKDHPSTALRAGLGNIRLSYADADGNGIITQTEIREENNYYPFGLKHKGYNNVVTSTNPALKFKYNGVEYEESLGMNLYEMDVRSYDPAIARFTSLDPVTHFSQSTYAAFDNNPIYWADPSGADGEHYNWETKRYEDNQGNEVSFQTTLASVGLNPDGSEKSEDTGTPLDDITVNSEGIVTKVIKNDKPNRFFDENGNELFFNDFEGVDSQYTDGNWSRGDRVFYPVTIEQVNSQIIKSGLIYERWFANYDGVNGGGYWLLSLFIARAKSQGDFDFAEGYLAHLIENPGRNDTKGRANYNNGAGFFRFGNSNNIYNLYDAGNFMWGIAMRLSGFSYGEVRGGSQLNETFRDSEADQRAIKKGFYGN